MAAKKRKRSRSLNVAVMPEPISLGGLKLKKNRTAVDKKRREKEVENDLKVVNQQINHIMMVLGTITKPEEQYSLRQQMMELLRFKYNELLEN